MAPSSLIINSPFARPERHWEQSRDSTLTLIPARRPAGYEIFDVRNNTRRTELLPRVNEIRNRVDAWREAEYPGVTIVTRKLLEHWHDASARDYPFYFCQLEAIETLIASLTPIYTVVIVTHNMAQARRASDHCVFMLLGEVVEQRSTVDMFLRPSQKATEMYVEGRYG